MRKSDSSEAEKAKREEFPKNLESGKKETHLFKELMSNMTGGWRRMGRVTEDDSQGPDSEKSCSSY